MKNDILFVALLCAQSLCAMDNLIKKNPPDEQEMKVIPKTISGSYCNVGWNNEESLIVNGYARLSECALMEGVKITVKEKAVLCLIGSASLGIIYMEPKSVLQLYDKSKVNEICRARTAVVTHDENVTIRIDSGWDTYRQGCAHIKLHKHGSSEEPYDGYPKIILFEKGSDEK